MKYKLLAERFGHVAGTIVYSLKGWDYGLASDDTKMLGVQHKSVTLDPDGDYPSFTVPVHELEEIQCTTPQKHTDTK